MEGSNVAPRSFTAVDIFMSFWIFFLNSGFFSVGLSEKNTQHTRGSARGKAVLSVGEEVERKRHGPQVEITFATCLVTAIILIQKARIWTYRCPVFTADLCMGRTQTSYENNLSDIDSESSNSV